MHHLIAWSQVSEQTQNKHTNRGVQFALNTSISTGLELGHIRYEQDINGAQNHWVSGFCPPSGILE
jgi:hypothetical protein